MAQHIAVYHHLLENRIRLDTYGQFDSFETIVKRVSLHAGTVYKADLFTVYCLQDKGVPISIDPVSQLGDVDPIPDRGFRARVLEFTEVESNWTILKALTGLISDQWKVGSASNVRIIVLSRDTSLKDVFEEEDEEAEGSTSSQFDKCALEMFTSRLVPGTIAENTNPALERYKSLVRYGQYATTPSKAAQIGAYRARQSRDFPIYDGRYHAGSTHESATRGPPVELFSPSFARFKSRVNDRNFVPDLQFTKQVHDFMRKSSGIYQEEKARQAVLSPLLEKIFARETTTRMIDKAIPDSAVFFEFRFQSKSGRQIAVDAPYVLIEFKNEPGAGGADAGVQAISYIEKAWAQPFKSELRELHCCPTFALALDGPWLRVYGCVLTDRWICQPLLPVPSTAIHSELSETHVASVSRIFYALCAALTDLEEEYRVKATLEETPFRPNVFPAPCQVPGMPLLRYVDRLSTTNQLTFTAVVMKDDGEYEPSAVVVKFVERYGEEAHRLLAAKGLAPKLWYYGRPYEDIPGYTEMHMVVMDHFEGILLADEESADALQSPHSRIGSKVGRALTLLHDEGLVYGDMRLESVIWDKGENVQLIKFDWAGTTGEAYYPDDTTATLPNNAVPFTPIKAEEEKLRFEALFSL